MRPTSLVNTWINRLWLSRTLFAISRIFRFASDPVPEAALFKRKAEALAVAQALERGRRKRARGLLVIQVKKTKRGVRVLEGVHVDGRAWKPKLRRN